MILGIPTGRNPIVTPDKPGFWIGMLRRLPGWVVFLLVAVLYTVCLLGIAYLTVEVLDPMRIAFTAISGLAVSAIGYWLLKWQRARERRLPVGWPTATNFRTAVSSGRIPKGAKAEQWVPELTKAIRQERHMTWIGMLLFTGFASLGVFLAIDNPDHAWFGVLATVFFAALALWYPLWIPRRRKKMQDLIGQFPDRDA